MKQKEKPSLILISVSEAARLLGLCGHTIRQAIRDKEVQYLVVQKRYRISFLSLLAWSQKNPWRKNKFAKYGIGQYVEKWRI